MNATSIRAASLAELQTSLAKAKHKNPSLNIGILFCSIDFSIEKIRNIFTDVEIALFGCTSSGEIHDDYYVEHQMTCLLLDLPKGSFQIVGQARQEKSTYEIAQAAGQKIKNTFADQSVLLLAQGVGANADEIVNGMKEKLGDQVQLYGGLAGDNLALKETFVFSNQACYSDGLMMLILDNTQVRLSGFATSGWEAIGVLHQVTKATDNVLYEIDGEPALNVFLKYFGSFDDADKGLDGVKNVSAQYPLQILRPDGSYVLRSPLFGVEEDKSLVLAGGVKEGDRFRFSISPGFEVIDQTVQEFGHFKAEVKAVDAMILFSCIGRLGALGPLMEDEIKGIHQYWNKPMAGFFSYGEIGATKGATCDFHNETCTLVTFTDCSHG